MSKPSPERASELFRGRVVHAEPGRVLIDRGVEGEGGGRAFVVEGPTPPIGAWVEVELPGEPAEEGAPARLRVLERPRGPAFPRPDGDWAWLHGPASGGEGSRLDLLRRRARLLRAIRAFFDERGFVEVETPIMVPNPGMDLHLDAFEAVGGSPARGPRWLITSPEPQMKRLLSGGLPRLYQLGRCARRGEEGALHQPEFTMLEWYRAFADAEAIMEDTEALVAHAAEALRGEPAALFKGRRLPLEAPWERLPVAEAFARFSSIPEERWLGDLELFFRALVEEIEPALEALGRPIFLTRWPAPTASLARLCEDDPRFCHRFEAYAGGLELCNGFFELTDPEEQRARFLADREARAEAGKVVYPIDERFMAALEEGLPPSGGNALGVDRLAMLLLGAERIEDVIAFSADRL